VGECKELKYKDPNGFDDYISIPTNLISNLDPERLIKKVFPSIEQNFESDSFFNSAILCPKNEEVDMINDLATKMLPGDLVDY
ncbi:unnamed protein product, partial [Brachionus calyciflorus]